MTVKRQLLPTLPRLSQVPFCCIVWERDVRDFQCCTRSAGQEDEPQVFVNSREPTGNAEVLGERLRF